MNRSWKIFTIIISSLLCVLIICTTVNVVLDKLTGKISPDAGTTVYDPSNELNNGGNTVNPNGQMNPNGQTAPNGQMNPNGQVTPNGQPVPNGNNVPATQPVSTENPLGYSKAEIIAYYNKCLNKAYAQPSMKATKTQHVDVSVSGVQIGSGGLDVDKITNSIVENNTKNNDIPETKTFRNGRATDDGSPAYKFVLPANLTNAGARSATVTKSGNGYIVVITLVEESCPHTTMPPHNNSCAWPLDFTVIDFGRAVTIEQCTFHYPGTVLTAKIDAQGRVSSVKVDMPLTVANAYGKAVGIKISVGAISGKWTCINNMSF